MNNKKHGTEFEKFILRRITEVGAWVHFLSPDEKGAQPFDIIAVKNGVATAIECKTLDIKSKYFPLSRLEENQRMAFDKWLACGNAEPLIVVEYGSDIKVIEYSTLKREGKVDVSAL